MCRGERDGLHLARALLAVRGHHGSRPRAGGRLPSDRPRHVLHKQHLAKTYGGHEARGASAHIKADRVGLRYVGQLNGAFDEFKRNIPTGDPFFKPKRPPPPEDRSDSITSFLCTAAAQNIFGQGASEFENVIRGGAPSEHPEFQPVDRTGQQLPNAVKNSDVIEEIGGFYQYATEGGRRGTPHQL